MATVQCPRCEAHFNLRPNPTPLSGVIDLRPLGLQPIEEKVARMVLLGLSNYQIMERTGLSLSSVKNRTHAIYGKAGVKGRAQFILIAIGGRSL